MTRVQVLRMARNRLSSLPKLERLTSLEYLDVSLNRIHSVRRGCRGVWC